MDLDLWNTLKDDRFSQVLICNIFWFLWKGRCSELYDHKPFDPGGALISASLSTSNLWESRGWLSAESSGSKRVDVQESWALPRRGSTKINIDGSFLPDSSVGAFGFIHRDADGIILAHFGSVVEASSAGM